MWVNNAASMSEAGGKNFQIWFKAKPTVSGTYTIVPFTGNVAGANEASVAFVNGSTQLWSNSSSGGSVTVTMNGAVTNIVLTNCNICDYTNPTACKTASANYSF